MSTETRQEFLSSEELIAMATLEDEYSVLNSLLSILTDELALEFEEIDEKLVELDIRILGLQ